LSFNYRVNKLIQQKNSLVCVGLDLDKTKFPEFIRKSKNPLFEFNKQIIDATIDSVVAYKLNSAFYEVYGIEGWEAMHRTVEYIPEDIVAVADAKRGDIGNTSKLYARAFFDVLGFDAITINPYMGSDLVMPFLAEPEKGVFVLCLTSNEGAKDFQYIKSNKSCLYREIAQKVNSWNVNNNCGLVVGATKPSELKDLRTLAPELPLLIPGLGAQGGDVVSSVLNGTDGAGNMALFNSSRGIIYQSSGPDFAKAAARAAKDLCEKINSVRYIKLKGSNEQEKRFVGNF
jgi:orotidine-5'-phosphate decarboxylase